LSAIASELDLEVRLEDFDELSRKTPCICAVIPNGPYNVVDLEEAGGVPGIMKACALPTTITLKWQNS